jgi:hypothetical protein
MSALPRQRHEGGGDDRLGCRGGESGGRGDIVWWLNDNFTILGIEGVLSMLNGEGCRELSQLHDLAASHDVAVLEDVPEDVRKLARQIVRKWWKPHGLPEALRRLKTAHAATVSDSSN